MASFLFLLALLVRVYYALTHPDFDNIFAVRGEPYSDGFTWTSAAVELARGNGLGSVYRPGFSVLLAWFFVWFGYSAHFITASQIVIGALTALFIYLVGERAFNRWIAGAATIFFIFDPSQLTQTPQATTEALGLLFFVASLYFLLLGERPRRWEFIAVSGVLLALSNLTRPLTLFCVPFYALQLVIDEWRGRKKLLWACWPAVIFCAAIALTMSPWLIRQRVVHGVWAVSTNLGEALYGATSPKYGTWTSLARADANRDGIAPELGPRYRYFMAKSVENIRRYPAFYTSKVAQSYWEFLNCFHLKVRARAPVFSFPQWTGLIEGQKLFFLLLVTFLLGPVAWWWSRSEMLRGGVFLGASVVAVSLWWIFPNTGFLILLGGLAMALWRYRWENIALLGWSIAGAGIGDAVFNNAILYRAVLMTDWAYSLIYFFSFYFLAEAASKLVLKLRERPITRVQSSAVVDSREPVVLVFDRRVRTFWKVTAIAFGIFALAGSVHLIVRNFGGHQQVPLRLGETDQREVIEQLRQRFPLMRRVLADPAKVPLEFVSARPRQIADAAKPGPKTEPRSPVIDFAKRAELAVRYEEVQPIIFYFPRGSAFAQRDKIFRERPYSVSILRTPRALVVFPGVIPRATRPEAAVLVGWVEEAQLSGFWQGQVMQCVALIPVTREGALDYSHAVIAAPRLRDIL